MSAVPRSAQILLVGQRIRQLRKSRHLTQAELASRIGIAQSDLSRMENGEYKVGLDALFRILQVFELSMGEFFDEPAEREDRQDRQDKAGPAVDAAHSAAEDQEHLMSELQALPEASRREVREFIAFKRVQAEARRDVVRTEDDDV